MSEVLQLTVDTGAPRRLGAPDPVFDPATAAAVERQLASARAEAHAEGEAAGRAAMQHELAQLHEVVTSAAQAVTEQLHAERSEATAVHLDLARRVAEVVLDRSPAPEALELLDRVRSAIDLLDLDDLHVRVHPDQLEELEELAGGAGLAWQPDPALQPGEARIDGAHSGVDLRRQALVDAALALLMEASA